MYTSWIDVNQLKHCDENNKDEDISLKESFNKRHKKRIFS